MTKEGGLIPIGVNGFKSHQGRLKDLLENISNPKSPGRFVGFGRFEGSGHGYRYAESGGNDKSLEHSRNL